jgi:Cof subfamily protein (haloacid dehalogenase superfamily)
MVKVIATDLDGTLLDTNSKFSLINKESKQFIKDFYGDIVIVSGRSPKFCAKICDSLKIHHNFIALNGAIIVKEGGVIYRQSMKKIAANAMIEFIDSYYTNYEILIFDKYDKIYSYSPIKKAKLKFEHFKHSIKNIKQNDKIIVNNKKAKKLLNSQTDIYKMIIYSTNCEDMFSLLKKEFKDYFNFFLTNHSIEIAPFGISKGDSLQYLINTTKLKNEDIIVVGDSSNDISLFQKFENSFAMESADTYTKSFAQKSISKFSDLRKYTKLNNNFKEEK